MVQLAVRPDLSVVSAFKAIRLFWLLDSQIKWSSHRVLINAINKSFNQMINLILILIVFLITAGVLGRWLFEGRLKLDDKFICSENGQSPRSNFDDILWSIATVLQVIVGDDWNYVWFTCRQCESSWSTHVYFIALLFLGKMILINSILTLMLGNFKEARKNAD